jgi:hypothetical protein
MRESLFQLLHSLVDGDRVVEPLGLFFRIEVIQVAEKLIEAVHRRQILVAISEMVLAELTSCIPKRLQQLCNSRVFCLQP